MPDPGAKMSTQVPQLEYDARASFISVAPTVSALAVLAGDWPQASLLLLPADTANTTPLLTALVPAVVSELFNGPPNDMFATAGLIPLIFTQSTAAMIPLYEPLPWQLNTRIATRFTARATPYVAPPTVPATCVPCP